VTSEPRPRGHIVVCGLTSLAVRTVEELHLLGERVVVIAEDPVPRYLEPVRKLAERIVEGTPLDVGCLAAAGVDSARALVLTDQDDVGNVNAALAATDLNPDIHIVLRSFDVDFGHHVESLFRDCVSLSASVLAAPGFVSAALDERDERRIEVAGRTLGVRHADSGDPSVVLPLADDRGAEPVLFPDQGPRPPQLRRSRRS